MVQKPDLSGFGSFAVLRPLTGGHRAQVWLVGRGGDLFVAKSTRRTEDQLRWLAPLQAAARRGEARSAAGSVGSNRGVIPSRSGVKPPRPGVNRARMADNNRGLSAC